MTGKEFHPTDSPEALANVPVERVTLMHVLGEVRNATYDSPQAQLIPGRHAMHDAVTMIDRVEYADTSLKERIATIQVTGHGFDYAPDEHLVVARYSIVGGPLGPRLMQEAREEFDADLQSVPAEAPVHKVASERAAREILRVLDSSVPS